MQQTRSMVVLVAGLVACGAPQPTPTDSSTGQDARADQQSAPQDTGVNADTGVIVDSGVVMDGGTMPADAGPLCMGAQIACGGACVDAQTDTSNCGSCGNACAAGETCNMGVCQPMMCPAGQTRCATMGVSSCVDLQVDNSNCGACGTACPAGQACTSGTCRSTCVAPNRLCDVGGTQTCIDVQTDSNHCGACGAACMGGQTCQAGACACPMGRVSCGGTCADTQTDNANCGACGTSCGAAQTCVAGACTCPMGQTVCGTNCINTQTDTSNCGMCGRACTAPSTCNMGVCNSLCGAGTTACGGVCVAPATFQTDNNNCGACGTVCGAGTACSFGVCRVANDLRANAELVTLQAMREVTVRGSTVGALRDGPVVPCACTSQGNVWYRFVVPTDGLVYVDTAGSSFDTSLFFTDAAGAPVPGQAGNGFPIIGLCNDDAGCGSGGELRSPESRSAGYFSAGTYYLAAGGCGSGALQLHFQYVPNTIARQFHSTRISGTGTTGFQTLGATGSLASSPCGGTGSDEQSRWFLACGTPTERQIFSVCRSDPGAFFTRRPVNTSAITYDPIIYVRSAQTGAQVDCNDDGTTTTPTADCRGTIPLVVGGTTGALDTVPRGPRVSNINTPRGIGIAIYDMFSNSSGNGHMYNMYFQTP